MSPPTWETAADWDAAQSETGVHHEQPAGTDWAASDTVEKGYGGSDWTAWSIPTPSLYWPLDEDSGTTATDVSGNGRDGTINGATVGNAGGVCGTTYFSFDGVDDGVDSSYEAPSGNRTLAAWFRTSHNFGGNGVIIEGGGAKEGQFRFESDNKIHAYAYDTSYRTVVSNTTLNDGAWHLGVFVMNEGTDIELFIDGASQGTAAIGAIAETSFAARIGFENGPDKYYTGDIDEAAIWNGYAMAASEVSDLYNAAL